MSTVEVVSSRALTAEEAAAEVSAFVSRAQAESEAAALQGDNGEAAPPALVRGAGNSVDARRCLSVDMPPFLCVGGGGGMPISPLTAALCLSLRRQVPDDVIERLVVMQEALQGDSADQE